MRQASSTLSEFDTLSDELRGQFKAELATLPGTCAAIALKAYEDRIERARERRLLGEYAPWLMADLAGCDKRTIRQGAIAWLYIYLFVLMTDDFIDRPDARDPNELIVGALLLQRGLTGALERFPAQHRYELTAALQEAFDWTAVAGIRELTDHRGRVTPFSQDQVRSTGKKLAMLRVCALAVASASDSLHVLADIDAFIEFFAVGLQLLDDLTDFDEDFQAGNWTMPLSKIVECGYATISPSVSRVVSRNELLALMIVSGAIESTLEEAIGSLRNAREVVLRLATSSAPLVRFLDSLISTSQDLSVLSRKVRERAVQRRGATTPWYDWIDNDTLAEVENGIRVVAQSS